MQDQKIYEPGMMVRLLDTGPRDDFGTSLITSKHGWLWVVEEVSVTEGTAGTGMYLCKSIATGALHNIFSEEMIDATQDSSAG